MTSASFISLSGKHLTFDLIIEPWPKSSLCPDGCGLPVEAMPNNR